MTYRWHIVGGIIAYVILLMLISALSFVYTLDYAFLWLFVCLVGALFPDIDTKSKMRVIVYRRWLLLVLFVVALVVLKNRLMGFLGMLVLVLPFIVKHRGVFHSIFTLFFLPLLGASFLSWCYPTHVYMIMTTASFFVAGACSHLVLDWL